MRKSKIFKDNVGYEKNSYIDFEMNVRCDKDGTNLTLNHHYLIIREFRLHNNPRLKGLKRIKNGQYEYL